MRFVQVPQVPYYNAPPQGTRAPATERTQIGYVSQVPEAWYKADAITGLADGDPVGTWPDSSGNGRDLVQATSSKRPLYKTAIQNGLPVVRGDGVDDFMLALFTLADPVHRFIVYQIRTGQESCVHASGGVRPMALREYVTPTLRARWRSTSSARNTPATTRRRSSSTAGLRAVQPLRETQLLAAALGCRRGHRSCRSGDQVGLGGRCRARVIAVVRAGQEAKANGTTPSANANAYVFDARDSQWTPEEVLAALVLDTLVPARIT